jgi:hypothetical protein
LERSKGGDLARRALERLRNFPHEVFGARAPAAQPFGERLEREPRIADETQRFVIAPDFTGIDVGVNKTRGARKYRPGIRAVLCRARADQENDVGVFDERLQIAARRHAPQDISTDAERERMVFGDRTFAHDGRHHGQVRFLLERGERFGCA